MKLNSYKLLDFGDGQKLEQFGSKTVVRPSSQAFSARRFPELWKEISAEFTEQVNEHSGWKHQAGQFENWEMKEKGFSLILRLQENGQIGLFPEHASYLDKVTAHLSSIKNDVSASITPPQVLNLFAYTGMCSIVAAKEGAEVCHVDSSKASLDWAKQNFELNNLSNIRLIKEDAVSFIKKESKRGKKYQVIVLDPPGFSRFKEGSWNISEVVLEVISLCHQVIDPVNGALFFTFHGSELNGEIIRNLILDKMQFSPDNVTVSQLCLIEEKTQRRIPSSTLITSRMNQS